jgi:hypothetical protein
MHNISLTRTHTTSNGSLHVELTIDGKDVGLLYLTQQEAKTLIDTLKHGADNNVTRVSYDLDEEEYFDYNSSVYDDEI